MLLKFDLCTLCLELKYTCRTQYIHIGVHLSYICYTVELNASTLEYIRPIYVIL